MVVSPLKSVTSDHQSSSEISTISKESFDPHSTKWSDVNLFKFGALIAVSSTIENAIFYPYVFYFSFRTLILLLI
jgi:hypothetical protein